MSFEPRGVFKSTRLKEYESYFKGVEDAMEVVLENCKGSVVVHCPITLRDKFLNLIVEAADDFTS